MREDCNKRGTSRERTHLLERVDVDFVLLRGGLQVLGNLVAQQRLHANVAPAAAQ